MLGDPPKVYMQILEYCSRTITIGKNKKREKTRKHRFNEVQQLPMSSGQKERDLINQSIQVTINGDNALFYIAR